MFSPGNVVFVRATQLHHHYIPHNAKVAREVTAAVLMVIKYYAGGHG